MKRVSAFIGRHMAWIVLAIAAGMFIGMGGMFMLLIKGDATFSFATSQLLGGFVFALGLFLVVAAGAELFTGNCLMVKWFDRWIKAWFSSRLVPTQPTTDCPFLSVIL